MERTRRLSRRSGIQLHIQSRHAHGRPASEHSLPTDGDKQLSNGVAGNEKTSHHVLLTRQSWISSDSAQVRCCALMGQFEYTPVVSNLCCPQGGYIFYAGGSLAGAGYCRQCRRRPAILLLQLWQGCQVCVKISAQTTSKSSPI